MGRSHLHVHDALRRWTNGSTTHMGELLTAALAQLEWTSEVHLTSLVVAWCRCNASHNARRALPTVLIFVFAGAHMQLSQIDDAW